nr:MAG TPA: hypothetical protein [Tombusviridae sp.]
MIYCTPIWSPLFLPVLSQISVLVSYRRPCRV